MSHITQDPALTHSAEIWRKRLDVNQKPNSDIIQCTLDTMRTKEDEASPYIFKHLKTFKTKLLETKLKLWLVLKQWAQEKLEVYAEQGCQIKKQKQKKEEGKAWECAQKRNKQWWWGGWRNRLESMLMSQGAGLWCDGDRSDKEICSQSLSEMLHASLHLVRKVVVCLFVWWHFVCKSTLLPLYPSNMQKSAAQSLHHEQEEDKGV